MERLTDYTQHLKNQNALRTTSRIFNCLLLAKNEPAAAAQLALARRHWLDSQQLHHAFMAAVGGQSTSGDAGLVAVRQNDLLAVVRPLTIIGKLQALRRIPFDAALTAMSGGTSAAWVGEGKPAPISKPTFSRLATPLGRLKVVALCVESDELVRSSDPDSEITVGRDFVAACIQAADAAFIDPSSAAIANVRPASITYNAPAFASSGSTAAAIDADGGRMMESLIANGSTLEYARWIFHPITAAFFSRVTNAAGARAYPDMSVLGGTFLGLPVIVSASVPHGGSPSIASIFLVDSSRIWIAEDPVIGLGISKAAALEMLDNPTNDAAVGTATSLVSMFQTSSIALRGTRTLNWAIASAGFAAVLNGLAD